MERQRPLAKRVEPSRMIQLRGTAVPDARVEELIAFVCPLDGVDVLGTCLTTTAYEGFELPEDLTGSAATYREAQPHETRWAVATEPVEYDLYEEEAFDPAPQAPPVVNRTFEISIKPVAPTAPKILQGFAAEPVPEMAAALPELALLTVRRKMAAGRDPKAAAAPPPVIAKAEPVKAEVPKIEQQAPKQPAPTVAAKAAPPRIVQTTQKGPAPLQQKPAQPGITVRQPTPATPAVAAASSKPPAAAAVTAVPVAEPRPMVESKAPVAAPPQPEAEKPKLNGKPAAAQRTAPAPTPMLQPSRPARDRGGNVVPVEREEETPAPAPKPKLMPIRKPEAPAAELPALSMGYTESSGFWSKASGTVKGGIVAAVLVIAGGIGYLAMSGGSKTQASAGSGTESVSPGMVVGGGGWTTSWGADSPLNKGRQISIYRPSMNMTDYRFEFRGQIERKAMGWIFRAQDAKNYYVMKLETIKPGPKPVVALVKYAVVNGKESTRTQMMLPVDSKLDTVYQVRLDVKGDTFTTYVQDQRVDIWTDDQIRLGGCGFFTDKGERAQVRSSQVSYISSGK